MVGYEVPSLVRLALLLSFCGVCGVAFLVVYRLYFSPLAKFPGPKLGALTTWYQFYYDVIHTGQFIFKTQDLHRQYGPIVRISPSELHVADPDFFDQLYSRSARRDRWAWMDGRLGNPTSVLATTYHDLHRVRRAALNPMFSRRQVQENFLPIVEEKAGKMCSAIAESGVNGNVVVLDKAYCAFSGDIITQVAFAKCYNGLDSPGFKDTFHELFMATGAGSHVMLHFPWMQGLMMSMPEWAVLKIQPLMHSFFRMRRDIESRVADVIEGRNQHRKELGHHSIIHTLLESNLPPREKSPARLLDEAQIIVGAGFLTTAWALSVASFHIIHNTEVFERLRKELVKASPDLSHPMKWPDLEQLPHLNACTREAVRLSYGISTRSPRVSPDAPMKYAEWTIPAGTPVSMTIYDVCHDERIFPDSWVFNPDRWLNNPRTEDGSPLDRYMVAFGKGSRSCLGINLANAELHTAIAAVFRRFTFELYETDASDVKLALDYFVPSPKLDSKGVRVRLIADELSAK